MACEFIVLEKMKNLGFYPKVVLDVGANNGDWSRDCHLVFPKAKFYLIEPQVEMGESLKEFCEETDSSYILCAVGQANYKGLLTIWDDMLGSSFLMRKNPKENQRLVDVVTIDRLISENKIKHPDLIKIDVQGFELEVLKGFKDVKDAQVIILEVSFFEFLEEKQPIFHEVIDFMYNLGFVCYDIFNFLKRPFDDALGQCDVCFVRKDSPLKAVNRWNK